MYGGGGYIVILVFRFVAYQALSQPSHKRRRISFEQYILSWVDMRILRQELAGIVCKLVGESKDQNSMSDCTYAYPTIQRHEDPSQP